MENVYKNKLNYTFGPLSISIIIGRVLVILLIPSGDEKLNPIPIFDGFRYPRLITIFVVEFYFNQNKSIFQPRLQCYNALSSKDMIAMDDYGNDEERGRE